MVPELNFQRNGPSSCGVEIVYERDDRRVWESKYIAKYIEFLWMHTTGKFDKSHFHVDGIQHSRMHKIPLQRFVLVLE